MIKGFIVGLLIGILAVMGGIYYYFVSGMAPAATADPPIPYEKMMARKSLNAHIEKQGALQPAVAADEENFLGGAKIYKEQCAVCHGLPGQQPPAIASTMYPTAPQLFHGKGVTDDPASESYWKVANGIRLTGMPSFKAQMSDKQLWQVAQLVAHADAISDPVKMILMPAAAPLTEPHIDAPAKTGPSRKK